jgi:predicted nucleic acid-binding protein
MDRYIHYEFAARVLPVDTAVALCCAGLHVPDPQRERDALIAATALVHAMTVVTRNSVDIIPTGARVVDPWQVAILPPGG